MGGIKAPKHSNTWESHPLVGLLNVLCKWKLFHKVPCNIWLRPQCSDIHRTTYHLKVHTCQSRVLTFWLTWYIQREPAKRFFAAGSPSIRLFECVLCVHVILSSHSHRLIKYQTIQCAIQQLTIFLGLCWNRSPQPETWIMVFSWMCFIRLLWK